MLARDRQAAILKKMQEDNLIRIVEIATLYGVSLETARRDLEAMQEKGFVRRIHGGAVLNTNWQEASQPSRPVYNFVEKQAIAREAAKLVHNGDVIFLDAGVTVRELAHNLREHHRLTVITYSLMVLNELMYTDNDIIMLGGRLHTDEQALLNTETEAMMQTYFVDKAFLSCTGITFSCGVSDLGNIVSRKKLAMQSNEMILMADSTKWNHNSRIRSCELEDITTFIVDDKLDDKTLNQLYAMNKSVIVAATDNRDDDEEAPYPD